MRASNRYPRRNPSEWQQLREAAVEHFTVGERPAAVARALNLSHETARRGGTTTGARPPRRSRAGLTAPSRDWGPSS